ncbi:hypothetical protein HPC49_00720 [Pyxidicoccus fallax]|uniref:Uncharacterized protein n=1 Tax=Pyxidicoccus fallax TaxID=394095 RepID=A0A848L896_9BACT|nr:hypothetical protein [Pyxidicoccus fallax]NMO14834.1 hypothetical protein [Pyxidicoccus fallax]NPC76775.1 hypothetical protein [Pyxidicoccus fallax]
MATTEKSPWRWLVRGAVVLGLASVLGLALAWTEGLPEGPVPVAWDREACAHCRMHVGEPAFAAQLQLADGRVLNFDDPGCLLRYEAEKRPAVHAAWFHHVREDRWIPGAQVAFVPVSPTPMGYGVGAVEAGAPGARAPAEVLAGMVGSREVTP